MKTFGAAIDVSETTLAIGDDHAFGKLVEHRALVRFVLAQRPFGQHLAGGFSAGAENSANRAFVVAHRRIGKLVPGVLGKAIPFHHQMETFVIGCLTRERAVDQRRKVGPDFRPDLAEGQAERMRVLRAEDRDVAVVIEEGEFGSPGAKHRVARIDHQFDHRAQRLRPPGRVADRRRRPVVGAHPLAHFAAALEERKIAHCGQ